MFQNFILAKCYSKFEIDSENYFHIILKCKGKFNNNRIVQVGAELCQAHKIIELHKKKLVLQLNQCQQMLIP